MEAFTEFPKIARLSRHCVVTEKLDGTNAQVHVLEDGTVLAGSRTRYITPEEDNYGFAKWVQANADKLRTLGPGRHFGEWFGQGIQRGYGLSEKRFALFNTHRWGESRPACCHVVPVLFSGNYDEMNPISIIERLRTMGSVAAPGFMRPEGIVIWHDAAQTYFKKTLEKDAEWKGKAAP